MTAPSEAGGKRASRLAGAASAYLRAAAEQPIDWHPWGNEPFELARRTGRPVLLDIGASWCHWCHVMDEGTYADGDVARLLGENFVAVKVDRDEHPEVDRRYQRQVGTLTGEGGWPLTAFLTADGEVFFGGTYFPPSDGHGRPGFRRVLREIARLYREEPERIRGSTTLVRESLARQGVAPPSAPTELAPFVDGVLRSMRAGFDPAHGGFGAAPKFPHPTAISLLLWQEWRTGDAGAGEEARETLEHMADGGLYDQLGGGFHRYSVDEAWRVPHFEKMGVDNAELLATYVEGFRRFGNPRFERVVRGVIGWADAVLADPLGGWGASQDADNAPGDDGGYFTWTRAEVREALTPEEARLAGRVFGLGTEGRMPHDPDRNVLFRMLSVAEAADGLSLPAPPDRLFERACEKLLASRARRATPTVDRALYASINGRFLGAYAIASAVFGESRWRETARSAANRWLASGYVAGRGIAHRLEAEHGIGFGLLDDQVSFARGLLELAVADREPKFLAVATELLELVDREFRGEDGLFRDVAPSLYDGPKVAGIGEAAYPIEDSPHLSANAAAALAFVRLGALLHDDRWTGRARALLAPMAARLGAAGLFAAGAALASGLAETPPVQVLVDGHGPAAEALALAAARSWHPSSTVYAGRPPAPFAVQVPVPAEDATTARAIVCFERSCAPPQTDPAEVSRLVRRGRAEPE